MTGAARDSSRRDDLVVVSVIVSIIAVVVSMAAVGFAMRAIDRSESTAAVNRTPSANGDGGSPQAEPLQLFAQDIAFSETALTATSGTVTIRFDNQEVGRSP